MNTVFTWLRRFGPFALIVAATLLVYLPAMHGGLLMDDDGHITRPELRSLGGLWRIWFEVGATAHYYPLLNTAFWAEFHLWGDAPAPYHFANILQHACAAGIVCIIMRQLSLPGALLGALLFALHPVHVDSVAWISEQKNTLSTALGLAAAAVYLRFDRTRDRRSYAIALLLFVSALLTKTVTAVLGPALLVAFWWKRGKLDTRRDLMPVLPWIVIGAALGLLSAWFEQSYGHAEGDTFQLSWLERFLLAGRAIWFYATKLVWPTDLSYIPQRWSVHPSGLSSFSYIGALMALTIAFFFDRRRSRTGLAIVLLFAGMLFPVLGFLNINWFWFSYVADHFQYLPSLALIIPGGAFLGSFWRSPRAWGMPTASGVGLLVCTLLGLLTFQRAELYASAEKLYRDTVQRNPAAWLAHHNLAVILMDQPDGAAEAQYHLEETLRLFPDHARAHNDYALLLARQQKYEPALYHFQRSLELQYNVPAVHANFGLALRAAGAPTADALHEFRAALALDSRYLDAQLALADTLASESGREQESLAAYERALVLAPQRAETHRAIADVLLALPGRRRDAIAHYREALRMRANDTAALVNLAAALADSPNDVGEAIALLRQACRLDPRSADARFNLGLLLSRTTGGVAEGLPLLREAVEMQPNDSELLTTVSRVLVAATETRREAAELLERVVRLRPNSAEAHGNYGAALGLIPGRSADARRELHRALELDPSCRVALEALSGVNAKD
ncbi:hypothetical protein DB347_20200 [Opitutaceae bacterium EW11]|nr:hypothetical protein DB347_20200 [Opitutaceae bacterium EW11]